MVFFLCEYDIIITMKKAIIFDMDGTLWDTTPLLHEVWNRCMQNYEETKGRYLSLEEIRSMMGMTMYQIGELTMPGVPEDRKEEIFKGCISAEDDELIQRGGTLYSGIEEVLRQLKSEGFHLYIVSNGQEKYASNFIAFYGFEDLFEDEETFGRTLLQKSENIRLIIKRNNIDKAVYVGDTLQDESSAREAGVPFIYASYGFGKAKEADAVISSLGELPRALKEIDF